MSIRENDSFHSALMDYRAASIEAAQWAYGQVCNIVDNMVETQDAAKYQCVLRLCAHISGCTVEQVDAQIVKVMSEQPMEKL